MNDWFLWGGLLVGLAGITVAVYFGLTSRRRRELRYSINSVRTRVVISGLATKLDILYDGDPLPDHDISAVQLAIWSDGKESIEPPDILGGTPITIVTDPPVRILEATIRSQSRPSIVGLTLPISAELQARGRIPLAWDILEKNDGASIQLMYLGGPEVQISVEGTIKGGLPPKLTIVSSDFVSPHEHVRTRRKNFVYLAISVLAVAILSVFHLAVEIRSVATADLVEMLFQISWVFLVLLIFIIISHMRLRFPPFSY